MKRLWPVALLVTLAGGFYLLGLQRYVSFAALGQQQAVLRRFITTQPVVAPLAYMAAYAAVVALSLPISAVMSVAAGVLFGLAAGTLYAVLGAGAGAVGVFLLARYVLGDTLGRRADGLMHRVRPGLERDGFSYLLALRLLPIVPFWLVNLAPAFAGMRLAPYAAATLIGIIPVVIVFVSLGAGFGDALAAGHHPDLMILFTPHVILPMVGLSALSLLPVAWRSWKSRRA